MSETGERNSSIDDKLLEYVTPDDLKYLEGISERLENGEDVIHHKDIDFQLDLGRKANTYFDAIEKPEVIDWEEAQDTYYKLASAYDSGSYYDRQHLYIVYKELVKNIEEQNERLHKTTDAKLLAYRSFVDVLENLWGEI